MLSDRDTPSETGTENTAENTVSYSDFTPASDYSDFDLDDSISDSAVYISIADGVADITGDGAQIQDNTIVIDEGGEYVLQGQFDGQLIVNAGSDDNVQLIFSDFNINNVMAPVHIVNAKNASITLAEGTNNSVSDSSDYTFAEGEDEPDSAVFSKCDLTVNGTGSLEVTGNYGCGIRSKDDLTIINGNISVNAVKDGIKGRDSVVIRDGSISVICGEDGIQSNNDEREDRGYVIIEGGSIEVSSGDDGIRGENWVQIYDGTITVRNSYEGIEAKKIEIYGGDVDIAASDDALNASSGSSEDDTTDGFDMNDMFGDFGAENGEIPDFGDMPDRNFVPGMGEESRNPNMNGGRDDPKKTDPSDASEQNDGAYENTPPGRGNKDGGFPMGNVPGSQDGSFGWNGSGGRGDHGGGINFGGGMGGETPEEGVWILIAGGTVRAEAGIDVIDSNGTFTQTGGTLITAGRSMPVYGSPEGIIDTNGNAVSEGGTFISVARSVGNSYLNYNKLNGFCCAPDNNSDFNQEFTVKDSGGEVIVSFIPRTAGTVILVTSELFEIGSVYTVTFGETVFDYTCADGIISIR